MSARVGAPHVPSREEVIGEGRRRLGLDGRTLFAALLVRSAEPTSVLDVGCKSGWLLEFLARELPSPLLVGLDLDATHLPRSGLPVVSADARRLPVGDERFDAVTLLDIIQHVPAGSEPDVLSEGARVLRPGGLLFLSTPADWAIGRLLDPAHWLIGHRHYPGARLRSLILDAGMEILVAETRGRWADVVGLPILYATTRLGLAMPAPNLFRRWANRDYATPGRYTHFVVARKERTPITVGRPPPPSPP